jgi:hypothetical protein
MFPHICSRACRYLSHLKLPAEVARKMTELCRTHDFSCARAHLVPSVPGLHRGPWFGHMRLRKLLQQVRGSSWSRSKAQRGAPDMGFKAGGHNLTTICIGARHSLPPASELSSPPF